MPDAFQVLKKDHEEMKTMLAQLEEGPKVSTGATADQLKQRKRAVEAMIIEEAKHEAVEQQYFWPAVRKVGPEGERVADAGLEQEAEADPILANLDRLKADDAEFEGLLMAFISAARAHIAFEEGHAWPLLRSAITAEEADSLGKRLSEAKKLAPTRAHPDIPPQAGPAKAVGPVAGVADRLRDVLTGRGRSPS
jgi:uncharacterized protein YdcH (DUF465 family)